MTAETALRDVRELIDRYLEVSNHYARDLRYHLREYETSPSRLSALIVRLEAIASVIDPTRGADASAAEEPALGQNIVRTTDTLAALRNSADEILERLETTEMESVPRNLLWLKKWLRRDVAEIAAGFPSFTYTWDKMIDLNRLTLVPDSLFLRVRDNVSLATMEFERFVLALKRLALLVEASAASGTTLDGDPDARPEAALTSLCNPLMTALDPQSEARVKRSVNLLHRGKDSLEQSIVREASRDVDGLALLGLELGFTSWLGFATPSREHRKTIIMSLLYCSKLFLVETSWQNAKEFSAFALALTERMNADLDCSKDEGTAMLRFNQLWARYKLGEKNINEDVEQWSLSGLHPRYSFLKSVLLRDFDDAVRLLETLLPKRNSGEAGNFSIEEADEWPILVDFRSSKQYQDFKGRLSEQAAR